MIPINLQYNSKIDSSAALSYKANIAPQNGTGPYGAGQTIIFNIPTRANLVTAMSENYLKFDCTFTTGATACQYMRWDSGGAHGLIQRIKIRHGSNLLQDIDDYGMLAKMFFDIQVHTPSAYGKYNILAGTRNDLIVSVPIATDLTITPKPTPCLQVNTGARLNPYQVAAILANTALTTQTYCLNLISLVGVLCPKYFPLFECTAAPLTVEITLVSSAQAALCSHTADSVFSLTNVEYIANIIELGDSAMETIRTSVNGPLQFVFNDYKMFPWSGAITANQTAHSVPIAAKFASVKSILIAIRDSSKVGVLKNYPYSSHSFNMSSYTFRIGPKTIPPTAPSTYPEMFAEVVKAIGSMSDLTYSPSIEMYSYCSNFQKASSTYAGNGAADNLIQTDSTETPLLSDVKGSGSFYVGLDLENYVSASSKDQFFAGYNSNTDDIYFQPYYLGIFGGLTLRYSSFVNIDSLLIFENGTVYANV